LAPSHRSHFSKLGTLWSQEMYPLPFSSYKKPVNLTCISVGKGKREFGFCGP
jgi:hypothetical protein